MAGQNIRRLRKAMDVSARELSELILIPKGRIEAWERGTGNPKAEDSLTLCTFFRINSDLLLKRNITEGEALKIVKSMSDKKADGRTANILIDQYSLFETLPNKKQVISMGKLLKLSLDELRKLLTSETDPENRELINEVIYTQEKISLLESNIKDKERLIQAKDELIGYLKKKHKLS